MITADVGGTAGLFLGASLLTVMEFIEFWYITTHAFIKKHCSARKVDSAAHKTEKINPADDKLKSNMESLTNSMHKDVSISDYNWHELLKEYLFYQETFVQHKK